MLEFGPTVTYTKHWSHGRPETVHSDPTGSSHVDEVEYVINNCIVLNQMPIKVLVLGVKPVKVS